MSKALVPVGTTLGRIVALPPMVGRPVRLLPEVKAIDDLIVLPPIGPFPDIRAVEKRPVAPFVIVRPAAKVEVWRTVYELCHRLLEPRPIGDTDDQVLRQFLIEEGNRARAAFLSSGGDVRSVEDFAFGSLGLKPAEHLRETTLDAVVEVLLSEEWCAAVDSARSMTYGALRKCVRGQVRSAHRVWKPLWENKICRTPIGSLNAPRTTAGGGETESGLLVVSSVDVEEVALNRTPSGREPVYQSLSQLSEVEQRVTLLVASGLTWTEAAAAEGVTVEAGRLIKRKAQRVTSKFLKRGEQRQRTLSGRVVRP